MKKVILGLVLMIIISSAWTVNATEKGTFNDVSENHWAKDNISKLVKLDIIDGYNDGSFRPEDKINIDAFIKLVVTGLGYTEIKNEEDYWATNYIDKALELNIIEDGQFDTYNRIISREEMASITAKALGQVEEKEDIQQDYAFVRNCIKDFYNIADKYLQDVVESYRYGIITGKPNGFDPKGTATRAEAVTAIVRLLDKSYRKPIFIPPMITKEDIKKDQDGMYFDVIRHTDYKSEKENIANDVRHKYRVHECPDGEITALQLMYAMDKVYQDNTGYVHLGQLGRDKHPTGVGYYCLDNVKHSYDAVKYVNHSEVVFGVQHSKHGAYSAYSISFDYKTHDMTYMERFNKYEKMVDTMLYYLYENNFQVMKDTIKEIIQLAEDMEVYQYNYTIKMNDREMYVEMNKNHSVRFYITVKGGKVEFAYPQVEHVPDLKKKF